MKRFGTAAILCGGKSTRMGFDKSRIVVNNKLLIENLADRLNILFDDVLFVANDKNKFETNYRVVEDEIRDVGPCGAIYTALNNSLSEYVFVLACDMPLIDVNYIKYLKKKLENMNCDCLITKRGDFFEPLCSFFSVNMKEMFLRNINKYKYKIMDTVLESNAEFTSDEEVENFTISGNIFVNLNYRKDLIVLNKVVDVSDGNYDK